MIFKISALYTKLAKNCIYDLAFRDAVSKRFGFTVYVYDKLGKLLNTFSSIIKFKQDNGIKLHHKTIYNYISQGKLVNGLRVKLAPLQEPDKQLSTIVPIESNNLKPIKNQWTH